MVESRLRPWESRETSRGPGREVILAALLVVSEIGRLGFLACRGGMRTCSAEVLRVTGLMSLMKTGRRQSFLCVCCFPENPDEI